MLPGVDCRSKPFRAHFEVFVLLMALTSYEQRSKMPSTMNGNLSIGSKRLRPAACAGRFYPAAPQDLRDLVNTSLRAGRSPSGPTPQAVIAPHAGYRYSGPVAGSAFVRWQRAGEWAGRVVVVGPSHYLEFEGVAVSSAAAFETPLGQVPVDREAVERIRALPQVHVHDAAHAPEHCLEVELPFLQLMFEQFELVPLLVGSARDHDVDEVLGLLWDGQKTRLVISSDLSHYHAYQRALSIDQETARAIEALRPDAVSSDRACGSKAVQGLLRVAKRRRLSVTTVDLRNSGDTAGSRDRVVGYGAFLFCSDRNPGSRSEGGAHQMSKFEI
jgi:MEMO1 family protein